MIEKHTEQWTNPEGFWCPANACRRCDRWFAPYLVGVPSERAHEYCWGHQWAIIYHLPLRIVGPYLSPEEAEQHVQPGGLIRELDHDE